MTGGLSISIYYTYSLEVLGAGPDWSAAVSRGGEENYSGWPCPYRKGSETLVDESVRKSWGIECRSILPAESGMDRTDPKLLQAAVPGLGLKAERHSLKQKSTSWCCMKKGPSYRTKIPRKPTRYLVSPIHRCRAQLYSIKRRRLRAGRRRLKWALLMTTTTGLDDTTRDLDSLRPSATAKKRSYCREFKTALLERRRSFSVNSLL